MRPTNRPSLLRAASIAAMAGLLAIAAVAATPAAFAASTLHATYRVTGSTYLKAPNFTMKLGPGKLSSNLNTKTYKLTARLTLPDATGSFKQYGIIPVTATTQFINDSRTIGAVNPKTGAVHTRSKITLRIVSLSVAGIGVPIGNSCETSVPVVVRVHSLPKFNVLSGGKLAGTYTIPDFAGCGLVATPLVNATLPGPGNTITLKLGKAHIG